MGSLYSKPRLPDPSVYAPVSIPTYAPATPDIPADSGGSDDAAAKIAAAVRKRSLPETILTSFRGVLSTGDWAPQRKSLLGE